jgi:hypothetical protein
MRVTYLAALVLGTSFHTASANCFNVFGQSWSDKGNARWYVDRACFGYDNQRGATQGYFNPGEEKRACINVGNNVRHDFIIKNENTQQGFDLADTDCRDKLNDEINGCDTGGSSTIAGWTFT